jgi:hypothetical protein
VATLDVVPPALVSAAAAVRCFSLELDPVVVRSGTLGDALTEFSARWSHALAGLADDAEATALSLREAATHYAGVDSLLVPRALR